MVSFEGKDIANSQLAEKGGDKGNERTNEILGREEFDWEKKGYFDLDKWKEMRNFFEKNNGLIDENGRPLCIDGEVVDLQVYLGYKTKYDEIYKGKPIEGKMYSSAEMRRLQSIRE